MNFEPSPEQRRLIDLATSFASETGTTFPQDPAGYATEALTALARRGLLAVRSTLDAALVTVALSRASGALGATFATSWLFLDALRRHGGGAPLVALASRVEGGTRTGCVALPAIGRRQEPPLVASARGEDVVLGGATSPAALLPIASDAILLARTAGGEPRLVCADLAVPGVVKGPLVTSVGLEGLPRGGLGLDSVVVPRERLLAEGAAAADAARDLGRAWSILLSAVSVGVAGSAVDIALSHVRAGGKLRQSTEFSVSDLATGYDAAFLSTTQVAWQRDSGVGTEADAAAARLVAARAATQICHAALGVAAEGGFDALLRRAYVDARHLELYDGSEAEQIDAVASELLGES